MNAPDRQLDFLYLGPQRTASSWLHKRLQNHPQIVFPSNVKETRFWDRHFDKGWDWYWSHFAEPTDGQVVGEIAPTLIDLPEAAERVERFTHLKVIIGVRDPVERTFSNFRHYRSRGHVPDDFFQAVKQIPEIETSGQYARLCPHWEQIVGKDNCCYLVQDDVSADPQGAVDAVCAFLGIETISLSDEDHQRYGAATKPRSAALAKAGSIAARTARAARLNALVELGKAVGLRRLMLGKAMGKEPMPDEVREHLVELHRGDIDYLEQRLGRRFEAWHR